MKTMATLAGMAVTVLAVSAMLLAALIELLLKLVIPISIGVAIWLFVRARRRNQHPATGANQPAPHQVEEQSAASPAGTQAPVQAVPALPPVLTHQHRSYVVVGRDSGFTAQAPGGYLRVDTPNSCAPMPVDHSALVARHLGRRPSRARSTRP